MNSALKGESSILLIYFSYHSDFIGQLNDFFINFTAFFSKEIHLSSRLKLTAPYVTVLVVKNLIMKENHTESQHQPAKTNG